MGNQKTSQGDLLAPEPACALCPRLVEFRKANAANHPQWHNRPVPSFGALDARLLIVGLAPGLKGANRTGRPFTGDYAGDLLYQTLPDFGLAKGTYGANAADGFTLVDCRITNAVRCVPPQNKPNVDEAKACRGFLQSEITAMGRLKVILALGTLAHRSLITLFGLKQSNFPFGHGAIHPLENGLILVDSYHCSRHNTQTGRLTPEMFAAAFHKIKCIINK